MNGLIACMTASKLVLFMVLIQAIQQAAFAIHEGVFEAIWRPRGDLNPRSPP